MDNLRVHYIRFFLETMVVSARALCSFYSLLQADDVPDILIFEDDFCRRVLVKLALSLGREGTKGNR